MWQVCENFANVYAHLASVCFKAAKADPYPDDIFHDVE